ncbi:MAG: hypothetical protein K8R67_14875 [Desulfobacteraceae bacterium]|nr:hypothetical protein [Desulfobacteraceae bacterium]
MALFRCNKCGHIREVGNDYIGKSVKCPKCKQITPIYDTLSFVKALIQKHIAQNKELEQLRQISAKEDAKDIQAVESVTVEEIDIHNT